MDAKRESEFTPMKNRTTVERTSERELVVTRTVNGPARLVFEAVMRDLYPSKEALDAAMASGEKSGMSETFEQLDELLVTLGASVGPS
ncbi:MAG: glutathione S-transferase [Pseudomonadota bacterium]